MKKINATIKSLVILILVCCLCAVGVVFAYLNQSIHRGYPVHIQGTNISFKLNGRNYLDQIGETELNLYKNQPRDVDVKVEVTGSDSVVADYLVTFDLETNGTDADTKLSQAIEVYAFSGARYDFVCMLDQIGATDESGAPLYTFGGQMVTNYSQSLPFRFVYSGETSSAYDEIASNGSFKLHAEATADIAGSSANHVFATDSDSFAALFENQESANKTIVLTDDITVSAALFSKGKVGIELNGHTLTLNADLTISYSKGTEGLGISNGKTVGGLAGTGRIKISGNDCYLIDSSAASKIDYTVDESNDKSVFDSLSSILESRLKALGTDKPYYHEDDLSALFDGMDYYFTYKDLSLSYGRDSVIGTLTNADGISYTGIVPDPQQTSRYAYSITLSYLNSYGKTFGGYLDVLGNSLQSIADNLMTAVPSTIDSTVFLRSYDSKTASHIEWIVEDGLGGLLLDSLGTYRAQGLDGLLGKLEDFRDRNIDIYVKLSKGAETGVFYYTRNAESISASERTALCYENEPIVLRQKGLDNSGTDTLYDFYDALSQTYRQKAEIAGISVKLFHSDTAASYLALGTSASDTNFATISIANRASIPQNYVGETEIEVTFAYADGKSHTFQTTVSVLGELAYVTRYDVSYRLQNSFSNNAYIDGNAYYFYAPGALQPRADGKSVQVLVDYDVEQSARGFVIITYEFVPVQAADIQDQVAYFVKNGESYSLYQGEISPLPDGVTLYERRANIEILPSRIPTLDETTVYFTATLYSLQDDGTPYTDENGNKLYYDAATDTTAPLQYKLSLTVQGIIQNSDAHIADYSLYTMLRDCFDANGDGIISSGEAQADWEQILKLGAKYAKSATVDGTTYRYLDLSGVNFSSLKGIEYFKNLQGLSFASASVTDITYLSSLLHLDYLDLSDNAITDISAFAYSDALQYLNLADNQITSIEPLRYLPALQTLDLTNNKVTDFDPLTVTSSLKSLTLKGMKNVNGQTFDNDPATMYSLATIQINNPAVKFVYDQNINISSSALIAAKVIHDVEEINRVNQTLYLPTTYYYSNGSAVFAYKLNWFADDTQSNLVFLYDADNQYSGYTISAPLFEKQIVIRLQIHLPNSADYYTVSRSFTLTLESSGSNYDNAYVYIPSADYYIPAEEAFPDIALRNKVFDTFNKITEQAIDIKLKDGSVITNETAVLSAADYERYLAAQTNIDWSNAGISDLSGIQYLKSLLTLTLDLSGNPIISLQPAASLSSLTGLILGGKNYDFCELYSADKLISLKTLDVSKSYGLDEEDTLNALYQVYLNNPYVSIYLKNSTQVWDPYETLLPKNIRNLTSVLTFINLNDSYPVYGSADATSFDFTFYGQPVPLSFTVDSVTIYENFKAYPTTGKYFQYDSNAIKYIKLYGWSESSYMKIIISADDHHLDSEGNQTFVTGEYYIQLNASDAGRKFYIYSNDFNNDFHKMTLSELIASRDIREFTISRLYSNFNNSSLKIKDTPSGNPDEKIQPSAVTLEFMLAHIGSESDQNRYKKYLLDGYGNYHILLQGVDDSLPSRLYSISGATNNCDNILKGLKYLTKIKQLSIVRDANLGDGSDLVNLSELTLNYSAVDLTTIKTTLNLTKLTISSFNSLIVNEETMKKFPNLTTLSIVGNNAGYLQDFSFLKGLIVNEKSSIQNLTLTSVIKNNNTIGISVSNAEFVKELYIAAGNALSAADNTLTTPYAELSFKVGTANKNNDTNAFFIVLPDGTFGTAAKTTATSLVTSWTAPANGSLDTARTEAENYTRVTNNMLDLGLQYKRPTDTSTLYWLNKKTYDLPLNTVLTLPKTSGKNWFGLQYSDTILRSYNITWHVLVNSSADMDNTATSADGVTTLTDSDKTFSWGTLAYTADEFVLTLTKDSYVVVVGRISPPAGVSGSTYSYMYQFVSGGGDGFYSGVTDYNLRATLFATAGQVKTAPVKDFSEETTGNLFNYTLINWRINQYRLGGTGYNPLPKCNNPYKVYDLTGFTKIVAATDGLTAGWVTQITRLDFSAHKITDISDLVQLRENGSAIYTSVQKLDLAGLQLNLPDNFSKAFPALIELKVSNNTAFTPIDLAKLNSGTEVSPVSKIQSLYIDGTRCYGSYDALAQLCALAEGNASKAFTNLAWNSATANAATADELKTLKNTIDSVTAVVARNGTLTSSSSLNDGIETSNIGGVSYTYVWDAYTLFTSRSVSQNPVDTIVAITSAANAQFAGVRFPVRYSRPESASLMYLSGDSGNHDISSFDSQLINYLFVQNCLLETSAGSNIWALNKKVTINTDIGISDLKNLDLLTNGSYSVTVKAGSNALAYQKELYEVKKNTLPSISQSNEYATLSAIALVNLPSGTIPDFLYYDSTRSVYTVKLPSYMWLSGVKQQILWSISLGSIADTPAQNNYITFTTDADGATIMTIDSSKIPANADVGEYSHKIRATVNGKYQESTFIIRHGAETSNAAIFYDMYVQVAVDGNQVVLQNAAGETYYVVEGVTAPDATLYLYNNKFYTQDREGATAIPVVFASTIIQSGRFRDWLQTNKLNNDAGKIFDETNAVKGYILSKTFIDSVTVLSFGNYGDSDSKGITTLSGIEIFYNLKSLTAAAGAFSNIDVLATLHLTTFAYGNSDVKEEAGYAPQDFRNFLINDFTPLLKGSKNTLTTFSYNGFGTTQLTDLNFLLGFTSLKTVNIATSNKLKSNANGLAYLRTSSFQYLLNALNKKDVNVFVHKDLADNFGLSYDTNVKNGTNVYALTASADFTQAAEVLSQFAGNTQTVTLEDGYRLTSGNYTQDGNNMILRLPAAINRDGTLYRIEWIKASANVTVNGYYLTNDMLIGNETFTADTALTAVQAQKILESTDYYTAQKAGETLLYTSITVNVTDASKPESCIDARAVCRIFSDGFAYERMFTLSMRGNTL